ncbi:unnamed protein product [Closterium sp. NIES-53]
MPRHSHTCPWEYPCLPCCPGSQAHQYSRYHHRCCHHRCRRPSGSGCTRTASSTLQNPSHAIDIPLPHTPLQMLLPIPIFPIPATFLLPCTTLSAITRSPLLPFPILRLLKSISLSSPLPLRMRLLQPA